MKAELEAIVRKELNLPDNAVITRASFQITDKDEEIRIIGSTLVEYQDNIPGIESDQVLISATETMRLRGKGAGRKVKIKTTRSVKARRESAEFTTAPRAKALPGQGSKITDAQIKGWKATLWARQQSGLLSDTQIAALKELKGTFARNLTSEQKQQVKDIFDETTPKQF